MNVNAGERHAVIKSIDPQITQITQNQSRNSAPNFSDEMIPVSCRLSPAACRLLSAFCFVFCFSTQTVRFECCGFATTPQLSQFLRGVSLGMKVEEKNSEGRTFDGLTNSIQRSNGED